MAFREYKIGCWMFGIALSVSMTVTIFLPSLDISSMSSTKMALEKQLTFGWESGFNYYDPFLRGKDKPIKVVLTKDPATGEAIDKTDAYVFPAGTHFPDGLTHDNILGDAVQQASVSLGKIDQASEEAGAVFLVRETDDGVPYIENATATRGWRPDATLNAADQQILAGSGKTMFIREGCWWCHTLLPEETQDWQTFGRPPLVGDFNGESPTTFGSDRKAPDLLHVGSRNSSREWMTMHFF
ncbi:MAG: cytochrome oxidase, partial [Zetaproteobacteria bacterium]